MFCNKKNIFKPRMLGAAVYNSCKRNNVMSLFIIYLSDTNFVTVLATVRRCDKSAYSSKQVHAIICQKHNNQHPLSFMMSRSESVSSTRLLVWSLSVIFLLPWLGRWVEGFVGVVGIRRWHSSAVFSSDPETDWNAKYNSPVRKREKKDKKKDVKQYELWLKLSVNSRRWC